MVFCIGCTSNPVSLYLALENPAYRPLRDETLAAGSHAFVRVANASKDAHYSQWARASSARSTDPTVLQAEPIAAGAKLPSDMSGSDDPGSLLNVAALDSGDTMLTVTTADDEVADDVHVARASRAVVHPWLLDADLLFPWTQGQDGIDLSPIAADGLSIASHGYHGELVLAATPVAADGRGLVGWGSGTWRSSSADVATLSATRFALHKESQGGVATHVFYDAVTLDSVSPGAADLQYDALASVRVESVVAPEPATLAFFVARERRLIGNEVVIDAASRNAPVVLKLSKSAHVVVLPFTADRRPILGLTRSALAVTGNEGAAEILPHADDVAAGRVVGSNYQFLVFAKAIGTTSVNVTIGDRVVAVPIVVEP